jgi:hypothetical protein
VGCFLNQVEASPGRNYHLWLSHYNVLLYDYFIRVLAYPFLNLRQIVPKVAFDLLSEICHGILLDPACDIVFLENHRRPLAALSL